LKWGSICILLVRGILSEDEIVRIVPNSNNFEVRDKITIGLSKRYTLLDLLFAAVFNHDIYGRSVHFHLLVRNLLFRFFAGLKLFFVLSLTHNDGTVNLKLLLSIMLEMSTDGLLGIVSLFDEELGRC